MLIETTIYVHKSILNKLVEGAAVTRKSINSIIKLLVQRIMRDNQRMIKRNSRIKYQERDLKENWHRIHVVLNEYEYEYCLDLRKFLKMSVSFFLAYAVLRYLDELLKNKIGTDNYYYKNYFFIKKTFDGTICWQIYWGIPPDLTAL